MFTAVVRAAAVTTPPMCSRAMENLMIPTWSNEAGGQSEQTFARSSSQSVTGPEFVRARDEAIPQSHDRAAVRSRNAENNLFDEYSSGLHPRVTAMLVLEDLRSRCEEVVELLDLDLASHPGLQGAIDALLQDVRAQATRALAQVETQSSGWATDPTATSSWHSSSLSFPSSDELVSAERQFAMWCRQAGTSVSALAPHSVAIVSDESTLGKIIGKFLRALGIPAGLWALLIAWLDQQNAWKAFVKALTKGEYKGAAKALGKLLKKMASKAGVKSMAKVAGAMAKEVAGKVVARFVPLLGWGLLIASLLYEVFKQLSDFLGTSLPPDPVKGALAPVVAPGISTGALKASITATRLCVPEC